MIDIHTHILFGVDDGSDQLEESLEMAELAVEGGTEILVATPHSNMPSVFENYESDGVCRDVYRRLQQMLQKERIPLQLVRGMEIFGYGDVSRLIRQKELISLNHSGYYLIEFPFDMHPDEMTMGLKLVFEGGGVPVMAHPERYYCVQDDPNLVYGWMREGVLSQVNRGSFFGRFGRREERTAHMLLEHNLITCIASDAHSATRRTPYMGDIYEYLEEQYSRDTADQLLQQNPERILSGRPIRSIDIRPINRKRRFFER